MRFASFAAREIVAQRDGLGRGERVPAGRSSRSSVALGLLGVIVPPEYGGAGMGYVDYALAIEELSAVDGSIGLTVAAHNSLGTNHIFLAGNEAQKKKYLPRLSARGVAGRVGVDRAWFRIRCRQRTHHRREEGRSVCAEWEQNIHHQRTLRRRRGSDCCDRQEQGHARLSAFVVEKGTPGFRSGKKENKLGLRASDTSELIFEDCEIPAENLLGTEGEGFIDAMRVLDGGRISIAALALGIGRGALDAALKYVKERRQFGKAIAEFQGIQWKLADMATNLDAARLLTYRAAVLKDAGRKVTRESSMAKLFASETAVHICGEAVQLFGGYGFIKDYPVEKFYRDVKLCTIGEGTSEIQRMVIAREILKVHPSRG